MIILLIILLINSCVTEKLHQYLHTSPKTLQRFNFNPTKFYKMKPMFKKKKREKVFYLLNDKIYFKTTLYASPFDIPISSMTFFARHHRCEYDVATSRVSFYKKPTAPKGSHLSIFRLGPKYLPHFRADSRTLDWLPDDPARSGSDNSSIATQLARRFIHVLLSGINSRARISLLSFIYLINAWRYIYKKQILTFSENINSLP